MKILTYMSLLILTLSCKENQMNNYTFNIDLEKFSVNNSILNTPVSRLDIFYNQLQNSDVYDPSNKGIEIGTGENVLDYAFITLDKFKGTFEFKGKALEISTSTKKEHIISNFGNPYWIDTSDNEMIMFYEYKKGQIELQFEFSDGENLSHITFMRNGVLSKIEQRKSYGVTKEWPPQ